MDQMKLEEQFNVQVVQKALEMDASDQNHALHHFDASIKPPELRESFDNEVYGLKGASILNWIEKLIGNQSFKECMNKYVEDG